jgi:hypothetical protein
MNDIYEQKAKKYKYKYLKLKKQYIGKGGFWNYLVNYFSPQAQKQTQKQTPIQAQKQTPIQAPIQKQTPIQTPIQAQKQTQEQPNYLMNILNPVTEVINNVIKYVTFYNLNYEIEYIGEGGFGCIISPPLQFNNTINTIKFPSNGIIEEKIYKNINYVGKLLSCDNDVFNKEYNQLLKLITIDPEAKYRSKLIFAAYMNKIELEESLENTLALFNQFSSSSVRKLYDCLKRKFLNDESKSDNYGYIISTRVGKSFGKTNLGIFNNEQIKIILQNLKKSIEDLIQNLYGKNYIHGDIKFDNMTLDDKLNVYFIDFGLMTEYTNINTYRYSINHQYPDILNIFLNIKNKNKNNINMNKTELIQLLNKKDYQKSLNYSILAIILNKTNLKFIDYSCFFQSIDNNEHNLKYFHIKCMEPISKNIDIYALSLFIYQLFINRGSGSSLTTFNNKNINNFNNVKEILNSLLINALYNNIDGPEELIIYLEAIIKNISIEKTFISDISEINNNIRIRREEKNIKFYYYYNNSYIDSKNTIHDYKK